MTKTTLSFARVVTAFAALLSAAPAFGALQDHGPADPVLVYPQWYRDLNGTAVGLCKSQVQSPNAAAGLAPMCFPIAANPAGFAGNVGDEIFYADMNAQITGGAGGFTLRYIAALEASYLPGPTPVHGQEAVFARIRVVANIATPGTYTVTHPYGIEVFPDVEANGPRSIFYTVDVPLANLDFEGALGGRVGPFLQWDVLNPGESLTVGAEQFLGDPNFEHTYTGSPFGTNYVRVDGPPGSNLDGAGNDFVIQPLGFILGQKWTAPIPTAFTVKKAVYSRSAALNTVDIWAASAAGQRLVATGTDMPSLQLVEFPAGQYYGHIEYPATLIPPASVTVTNLSSNPVNQVTAGLTDQIDAVTSFDPTSRVLTVAASSSDLSGPTLVVLGPSGGLMTNTGPGTYTFTSAALPATTEPPMVVNVQSNAGGVYESITVVGSGNPMNGAGLPVAVNDLGATVDGTLATSIPVLANDTFAGAASILVLTQPATGTAVATAAGVTYTPRPGASGADQFTYVVQDAAGISNVALVTFLVPFTPPPPTVVADNTATQANTTRVVNVLANDTAGVGTVIDPLSIQIASGAAVGTGPGAFLDAAGNVNYRAGASTGTFTFTYTVANTAGTRSAPATVTMVVFGGTESLSYSRVQYTVSKLAWSIAGSTTWFAANLTQASATCWTGTATAPTATTLIGTAPIDTTGKFQLVPVGPTPRPVNPSSITCQTTYGARRSSAVSFK